MKFDGETVHFAGMPVSCSALGSCDKAGKKLRSRTAAFLMVWCPSAAPPAAAPLRLERSAGGCERCACPSDRHHKRVPREERPYLRSQPIDARTP